MGNTPAAFGQQRILLPPEGARSLLKSPFGVWGLCKSKSKMEFLFCTFVDEPTGLRISVTLTFKTLGMSCFYFCIKDNYLNDRAIRISYKQNQTIKQNKTKKKLLPPKNQFLFFSKHFHSWFIAVLRDMFPPSSHSFTQESSYWRRGEARMEGNLSFRILVQGADSPVSLASQNCIAFC